MFGTASASARFAFGAAVCASGATLMDGNGVRLYVRFGRLRVADRAAGAPAAGIAGTLTGALTGGGAPHADVEPARSHPPLLLGPALPSLSGRCARCCMSE